MNEIFLQTSAMIIVNYNYTQPEQTYEKGSNIIVASPPSKPSIKSSCRLDLLLQIDLRPMVTQWRRSKFNTAKLENLQLIFMNS